MRFRRARASKVRVQDNGTVLQGLTWSFQTTTIATETPRATVGVGLQRMSGVILEANGYSYGPIIVICGLAYVTTLLIIHLLAPKLEPMRLIER